jgi:hypothetical protein
MVGFAAASGTRAVDSRAGGGWAFHEFLGYTACNPATLFPSGQLSFGVMPSPKSFRTRMTHVALFHRTASWGCPRPG